MVAPTILPVPSIAPQDLLFNAAALDYFINGTGPTVADRFGNAVRTLVGVNEIIDDKVDDIEVHRAAAATAIASDVADAAARRVAAASAIAGSVAGVASSRSSAVSAIMTSVGLANGEIANIVSETESAAAALLAGLGYQVPVAYTAGVNLTQPSQTVSYNDVVYAPVAGALPFTTSGAFEVAKFRVVQSRSLDDLAGIAGASFVGRAHGTVETKLREVVSITDKGAIPNAADSAQAALDAAVADSPSGVFIPKGDFNVSNMRYWQGPNFAGPGRLLKPISGGRQQLNSYADRCEHIEGREYMAAFHNVLIELAANPYRKARTGGGGDSTEEGASVNFDYRRRELFKTLMYADSVQTPLGTEAFNIGFSGWDAEQWRLGRQPSTPDDGVPRGLQLAIALDLDLLELSLGINTPGWLKNGSPAPANAGDSYPNRRDAADYELSMRGILTALRAVKTVAQQTIILAVPNSTSDTPNGRDEKWYELIAPITRSLAREFCCVFVDKYALWRDSRNAVAGGWMDDIVLPGSGNAVHPLNVMNLWIASVIHQIVYPPAIKAKLGLCTVYSVGGGEDVGDGLRGPNFTGYKKGIGLTRALNNFPSTGSVITFRTADETLLQIFFPFTDAERYYFKFRIGVSVPFPDAATMTWGDWVIVGGNSLNVVPQSGYIAGNTAGSGAMRVAQSGSSAVLEGFLSMTAPAAIAAGTVVAVVPIGLRPLREALWSVPLSIYTTGGTWEFVRGQLLPDGTLTVAQAVVGPVDRIYANASWSLLP